MVALSHLPLAKTAEFASTIQMTPIQGPLLAIASSVLLVSSAKPIWMSAPSCSILAPTTVLAQIFSALTLALATLVTVEPPAHRTNQPAALGAHPTLVHTVDSALNAPLIPLYLHAPARTLSATALDTLVPTARTRLTTATLSLASTVVAVLMVLLATLASVLPVTPGPIARPTLMIAIALSELSPVTMVVPALMELTPTRATACLVGLAPTAELPIPLPSAALHLINAPPELSAWLVSAT